jgi:uncharacterized protein YecE (DUF72 family)
MEWKIGCSGFYYREWKEQFYPKGLPQKDWFKYYCEHFNTIEINSSFYKMPTEKTLSKWYNDSPSDFVFTVKAPRLITHYKKLHNCKNDLLDFQKIVTNILQEKLSCTLFQFPPSFSFSEERLSLILQLLSNTPLYVVEFRHASWWNEGVYQQLAANQIIFAGQNHPANLPKELIKTADTLYYRFHGNPMLYVSKYELATLQNFVAQVPAGAKQLFVYFNNTSGNGAIENAQELMDLVKA